MRLRKVDANEGVASAASIWVRAPPDSGFRPRGARTDDRCIRNCRTRRHLRNRLRERTVEPAIVEGSIVGIVVGVAIHFSIGYGPLLKLMTEPLLNVIVKSVFDTSAFDPPVGASLKF